MIDSLRSLQEKLLLVLVFSLILYGCNNSAETIPTSTTESHTKWQSVLKNYTSTELENKIFNLETATLIDFDTLIKELKDIPAIYVGETYQLEAHHKAQAEVLQAIYNQSPSVALGMEMFQQPYQKYLDEYLTGKITERMMLEKTEYTKRWGFDWLMYRPLVNFARENGLKVIALNVPAEISEKVILNGLKSLAAEERTTLPEEIDTTNTRHRAYIREVFDTNPMINQRLNFENFYEAQCVWEDGMADCIARYLKENPGNRLVVTVGSGHIVYGFGIPQRAAKRSGKSYRSIMMLALDRIPTIISEATDGANLPAHYFWFTRTPKRAMLGIETDKPQEQDKGIIITRVIPGSPAEKAGLKQNDIILKVNDTDINDITDLRLSLKDKKPGAEVTIRFQRDSEVLSTKARLAFLE